jgi:hypothetical protein
LESTRPTVAKRVTRVQKCLGTPDGEAFEELVSVGAGFFAQVEMYTYFGVPYATAMIACNSEAPRWKPGWGHERSR